MYSASDHISSDVQSDLGRYEPAFFVADLLCAGFIPSFSFWTPPKCWRCSGAVGAITALEARSLAMGGLVTSG